MHQLQDAGAHPGVRIHVELYARMKFPQGWESIAELDPSSPYGLGGFRRLQFPLALHEPVGVLQFGRGHRLATSACTTRTRSDLHRNSASKESHATPLTLDRGYPSFS